MPTRATQMNITREADEKFQAALDRYNERYENQVYLRATANSTTRQSVALQDEALALCGSPYQRITRRPHTAAQEAFLALFI